MLWFLVLLRWHELYATVSAIIKSAWWWTAIQSQKSVKMIGDFISSTQVYIWDKHWWLWHYMIGEWQLFALPGRHRSTCSVILSRTIINNFDLCHHAFTITANFNCPSWLNLAFIRFTEQSLPPRHPWYQSQAYLSVFHQKLSPKTTLFCKFLQCCAILITRQGCRQKV